MLEVQVHRICAWCHQTIRRYTATEPVGVNETSAVALLAKNVISMVIFLCGGPHKCLFGYVIWRVMSDESGENNGVWPFCGFMESQKSKNHVCDSMFFQSLVFIVTSKNLKKTVERSTFQSIQMPKMAVILTEGFDFFHAQRNFEPPANHW